MRGYIARKGDRYYAVIYEGLDPLTGRERRRWHPAGTDEALARQLATDLADRRCDDSHERASLTVAVYLTQRWLPSKQMALRASTWDGYRRMIALHVVPRIGKIPLRHTCDLITSNVSTPISSTPAEPTAPVVCTTRRS